LNAKFQFSQKTNFKCPWSGAAHVFTNNDSYLTMCSDKTLNYDCAKLSCQNEYATKSYKKI